jgi:hypothetical protein
MLAVVLTARFYIFWKYLKKFKCIFDDLELLTSVSVRNSMYTLVKSLVGQCCF